MMFEMKFTDEQWSYLHGHLFGGSVEAAAFLLAESESFDGVSERLTVRRVMPATYSDTAFASRYYLSLDWDFVGSAIAAAWADGLVLIEAHSHLSTQHPPAFSVSDLEGLGETVPHVKWRTRGATYASLVITPTGFTGLAWPASKRFGGSVNVDRIVIGTEVLRGVAGGSL